MSSRRFTQCLRAVIPIVGMVLACIGLVPSHTAAIPRTGPTPSRHVSQLQSQNGPSPARPPGATPLPLLAYYYIWFDPSTWERGKDDKPLQGTYSSDETSVMRRQILLAKAAGIDGFLVSWKDSSVLSSRLLRLSEIAAQTDFKLGIVYQALNFSRFPLPVSKITTDMRTFVATYATNPVFDIFGKPMVVISGSGQFSEDDLRSIVAAGQGKVTILASAKTVDDYRRVASIVDGNAYYWSSANPDRRGYAMRLRDMAAAVHSGSGLWIAPAAPGFDARLVGGSIVVPRADGETLRRELDAAMTSSPDAIGIISWNEYSENSHIEPSMRYGDTALSVISAFSGSPQVPDQPLDSSSAARTTRAPIGLNGATAIVVMLAILGGILVASRWRRANRAELDKAGRGS